MAFTSLNHYLDVEWLEYAFECTRKDGAVGVDGQTGRRQLLLPPATIILAGLKPSSLVHHRAI